MASTAANAGPAFQQPPISLSHVVQQTNSMIMREMEEYHDIDRKRREQNKKLEEIDCVDMLQKNSVNIKQMKQLLDRLIPFDDDHMVIKENKTYSIEVIENNMMTFRVPCKQANSPAKFTVTFNSLKAPVANGSETTANGGNHNGASDADFNHASN